MQRPIGQALLFQPRIELTRQLGDFGFNSVFKVSDHVSNANQNKCVKHNLSFKRLGERLGQTDFTDLIECFSIDDVMFCSVVRDQLVVELLQER